MNSSISTCYEGVTKAYRLTAHSIDPQTCTVPLRFQNLQISHRAWLYAGSTPAAIGASLAQVQNGPYPSAFAGEVGGSNFLCPVFIAGQHICASPSMVRVKNYG